MHPKSNEQYEIYTDASDNGMVRSIVQKQGIKAIRSQKLTPSQSRYTIIENELLSLLATLKIHRKIILGSKVFILTDNKNHAQNSFTFNTKV